MPWAVPGFRGRGAPRDGSERDSLGRCPGGVRSRGGSVVRPEGRELRRRPRLDSAGACSLGYGPGRRHLSGADLNGVCEPDRPGAPGHSSWTD
jgi:hypothetical protein